MKKLLAVLKREYLQTVRKKMFIIMTFLMPVLIAAVLVLPSLIMARGYYTRTVLAAYDFGLDSVAVARHPRNYLECARRPHG